MRKRQQDAPAGATRLVFSTGGERSQAAPAQRPKETAHAEMPRAQDGKGIRLRLEHRPGGRTVTVVLGLSGTDGQIAALAKDLKSACGTGGTVKDGVVELQGDHRAAAQAVLAQRGLKARL
jgi:translation initiation factor 1